MRYLQAGDGAVWRTVQDKLRDTVAVKDFAGDDDVAFSAGVEAIRAQGNGVLHITSDLAPATTLKVMGEFPEGFGIDGERPTITVPDQNTNGLLVGNEVGAVASSYFNKATVRNIVLVGAGKAGTGVGLRQQAAADFLHDSLRIRNFNIGLHLYGALTSDYRNICVRDNAIGVKAEMFDDGAGGLASFAPNANSFYGLRCFYNDVAVKYLYNPSGVVNWIGSNFESNNQAGTAADGVKVLEFTNAGHQNFIGCHFEANAGQYGIHYTGFDAGKSLFVAGSEVIHATDTVLQMAKGRLTAIASRITNGTATNDIYLEPGARATLIDSEARVSGDMSYVGALRDGRLCFGGQPITTDPVINVQSAPIVAAGNIAANFRNDTVQLRFQNTAGTRVGYFQTSAAGDHTLQNDNAAGGWSFRAAGASRMYIGRAGASSIESGADNTITNGSAALRWAVVYAGTATINTSDERYKVLRAPDEREMKPAGAIEDAVLRAWSKVEYCQYKFRDAVEAKGDGARWHFGVIAQRVKEAFEAEGLDPFAYGLLCYDEWTDQYEPIFAERTITADDGTERIEVYDTGEKRLVQSAGNRYGVRYEEALALECAYLRARIG